MEKGKISIFAAILMNINMMVGAGIYINPMIMAEKSGNASFLGWPLAGILFLPIVWSVAQMSRIFPGQGSFYSYSKNVLGPSAGFISGWLYFLGWVSIGSLQAIGLREVLIYQFDLQFVALHPIIFNLVFLTLLCLLNFFHLILVARIQSAATILKLMPILFVLCIFLFYWNPNLEMFAPDSLANLKLTVPAALFGFWGFEVCTSISHLIKGDKRNASRAILTGFFLTVLIYTIFHLGILHIMGANLLSKEGVAAFVSQLHMKSPLFTAIFNSTIYISIILAYLNAIHGGFIANSSLLHAMADEDIIFFSPHLRKTNKYGRPWISVALHGLLLFLFISIINHKDVLNAISNLGMLTTFFLTFISLILIQKARRSYVNGAITLVAFVSAAFLGFYSWQLSGPNHLARLINTIPLFLIMILGITMFFIRNKMNQRSKMLQR
jgi:APA family basic amino acid/polyamine antiporter